MVGHLSMHHIARVHHEIHRIILRVGTVVHDTCLDIIISCLIRLLTYQPASP